MNKPISSNPLSLNDSREHSLNINQSHRDYPQTNNSSVTDAVQERITYLETESCVKGSDDILMLELDRMRSADVKATSNKYTFSFGANEATGNNENMHQKNTPKIITVPTADPFSRKKNAEKVHRARRTFTKVLNPASCSSGMDLLALAQIGSNGSGSLSSPNRARRTVLNPNSCASGLNLLNGLYHGSMRSMSSGISASELLRASQQNNASSASLSSGNIFALLLGNARILSSSSLMRGSSSRNNTRLNSTRNNQGTKRNADWDVFE
mmetsp:Transcript_26563/g.48843  ORF Transcript_26563/g.48843 Transcript_26563/m.48843 type:complete len:268 (-) Transcript_26563:73-876(-)